MSIRRSFLTVLVLLCALSAPAAAASPKAGCLSCILVDEAGDVLFERAPGRRLPNASTTKMVTALLVRQHARLGERVAVSPRAAATGGGTLNLQAGESYPAGDLLHALLMASSNDAAVALAEHVAGSERAFVREMNAYAARTGLVATRFITAHGLDEPGHFSSARDLAAVAERLLADPVLAGIVATRRTTIHSRAGRLTVQNRNVLLDSYSGAVGVKTGYTARAGNVLVAAAERNGVRLIAVALGSEDAFGDARRMLDYGFARVRRTPLLVEGQAVAALLVDGYASVDVVSGAALSGLADPGEARVAFTPSEDLVFPLLAGERVGTVEVAYRGRPLGRVAAVTADATPAPTTSWATRLVAALLRLFGRAFGAA